ncbi:MAG: hypothetical protein H7Y41_01790 [Hyphomonadaceae bacterium]|nr:hypothetical protein [Clostridia bacterium]
MYPFYPYGGYFPPNSWQSNPFDANSQPYALEQSEISARRPILSNPPAVPSISLFKELVGYNNYGNPSGNADILYTGSVGEYTFNLPPRFLNMISGGKLAIRAVLDDHYNVPVKDYSARITVNGRVVHNGPVPLQHGTPGGQKFNNWRTLSFNVRDVNRQNRITIKNTSKTGENDWIALDWMELFLTPKSGLLDSF